MAFATALKSLIPLNEGITRFLDEETRFAEAVKLGIAAADRGDFVSAEKVWEHVERILQS